MGVDISTPPAIPHGTYYYSADASQWNPRYPDTDQVDITRDACTADADNITFRLAVNLPHGAVVTNVIVYGNAAAAAGETWQMTRADVTDGSVTALTNSTAFNTADSTIDNATIDNSAYAYAIGTTTFDTADEIYGAVITYTL